MEENNLKRNGRRNFWLGLLIGTVVGTGASMLYAPRSGAETRAFIRKKAGETRDGIANVITRRKSKAETKAGELKHEEEKVAVG